MKGITIHRLYGFRTRSGRLNFGIDRWDKFTAGFRYSIRLGFIWVRVA